MNEEIMTLRRWILNLGDDPACAGKAVQKLLDLPIQEEVSSVNMEWADYLKRLDATGIRTMNCYHFVILEGGRAVGFNEHPSRGWSYPIGRIQAPQ